MSTVRLLTLLRGERTQLQSPWIQLAFLPFLKVATR